MTSTEARAEILRDLPGVLRKVDAQDTLYRRAVIKAPRFPLFFEVEFTSRNKNRWILFFEARSKRDMDDSRVSFACVVDSRIGLHAFMPTTIKGDMYIAVYPPHFFSRYRDRFCPDLTGLPLIKRYFRYNYNFSLDFVERDGAQELHAATLDGVGLGVLGVDNMLLFKTFVSFGMLKGEQVEKFADLAHIRAEIHESLNK